MTGVVRDLFRAHPGRFRIGISCPVPEPWQNNPFITHASYPRIPAGFAGAKIINLNWGIHGIEERRMHFMEALSRGVCEGIGIEPVPMTEPNGDLYFSAAERQRPVAPIVGTDRPYVLLAASFKTDCRTKSWPGEYWQAVVDGIKDRVDVVQIGHHNTINPTDKDWLTDKGGRHHAWKLSGTIDRIGQTGIRELMLAVRSARCVIGQITFVNHLAGAIRREDGSRIPHIIIAGGREGQFVTQGFGARVLHTIGSMDCCWAGGCWKSHLDGPVPNQRSDSPQCLHPVNLNGSRFAGCMMRISPELVIETVRSSV